MRPARRDDRGQDSVWFPLERRRTAGARSPDRTSARKLAGDARWDAAELFGGSLRHDLSTLGSAARTQIDDPIRRSEKREMVLDRQNRVAERDQPAQASRAAGRRRRRADPSSARRRGRALRVWPPAGSPETRRASAAGPLLRRASRSAGPASGSPGRRRRAAGACGTILGSSAKKARASETVVSRMSPMDLPRWRTASTRF